MSIPELKKQPFDFTSEEDQSRLIEWEKAIMEIPFPKKFQPELDPDYMFDPEEKAVQAFSLLIQYLDVDDDTWFMMIFVFEKNGTAYSYPHENYSVDDMDTLLPQVNKVIVHMGFKAVDSLRSLNEISIPEISWQVMYDKLCDIARNVRIPQLQKK